MRSRNSDWGYTEHGFSHVANVVVLEQLIKDLSYWRERMDDAEQPGKLEVLCSMEEACSSAENGLRRWVMDMLGLFVTIATDLKCA